MEDPIEVYYQACPIISKFLSELFGRSVYALASDEDVMNPKSVFAAGHYSITVFTRLSNEEEFTISPRWPKSLGVTSKEWLVGEVVGDFTKSWYSTFKGVDPKRDL